MRSFPGLTTLLALVPVVLTPVVLIPVSLIPVSLIALGCGKTEQYKDTGERFRPIWVRQSDGARATREELIPARDACAAAVRNDTRRASEAFASDVWAFEMKKCMSERGFDLVEKPKAAPAGE